MTAEKKNVFCKFFTGILFCRFGAAPLLRGCKKHPQRASAPQVLIFQTQPFMMLGVAFFSTTSWLPPSTMEVEDTTDS